MSRRRFLVGGAAASAIVGSTLGPGRAAASDDDDVAVLADSPVNAAAFTGWSLGTPSGRGAALVAALAHAATNELGRVFAPEGVYEVAGLSVPAGVHLFGDGPGTVFDCPSTSVIAVSMGVQGDRTSGEGAWLSDLTIVGHQLPSVDDVEIRGAIDIRSRNCRVERVQVETPQVTGIRIYTRAANTTIMDCGVRKPFKRAIHAVLGDDNSVGDYPGHTIVGNGIDNSEGGEDGICVMRNSSSPSQWLGTRVIGNRITCGPFAGAQCIEFRGGGSHDIVVADNVLVNGNMGISLDRCDGAAVTGNVIRGFSGLGIEIGGVNDNPDRPNTRASIVGNVVDGRAPGGVNARTGIVATKNEGKPMLGILVAGNVVRGCVTGIAVARAETTSIIGNHVRCPADEELYAQDTADDDLHDWSGIALTQANEAALVVGNHVDGGGVVPAGIRFRNTRDVVCIANVVRNCAEIDERRREIYIRPNSPSSALSGDGTRGAVSGNTADTVLLPNGGAAEDLRVATDATVVPTISRVGNSRLIVPGTPVLFKVANGGVVWELWNFRINPSGSPATYRAYPGRELTLVFTSTGMTLKRARYDEHGEPEPGQNLDLLSDFSPKAGDTLTLVGDGERWAEVSRSVN